MLTATAFPTAVAQQALVPVLSEEEAEVIRHELDARLKAASDGGTAPPPEEEAGPMAESLYTF